MTKIGTPNRTGGLPVKRDLNNTRPTGKLIISHGDSHPFGEKCKTCDKIKKEYEISMDIKDKNSLHNRIHKEGFDAGYKKGYKDGLKNVSGWSKEYDKMMLENL